MRLASTRSLEAIRPVLKDQGCLGPDTLYWVFSDVSSKWANVTIIAPGKIGEEYPKTFGHYHPDDAPDEIYHLIEGEGVLILQKEHFEGGILVAQKVDEVLLVKAKSGDEIVIRKEYGHSWSNVGKGILISYDNWKIGHTPADYQPIEKMHGMAYYLVEEDGAVKAVANSNYMDLPEPVWLTAEEFKNRG